MRNNMYQLRMSNSGKRAWQQEDWICKQTLEQWQEQHLEAFFKQVEEVMKS